MAVELRSEADRFNEGRCVTDAPTPKNHFITAIRTYPTLGMSSDSSYDSDDDVSSDPSPSTKRVKLCPDNFSNILVDKRMVPRKLVSISLLIPALHGGAPPR
eukprot:1754998-Pyramimonas_sp.AAC.2